MNPVCRICLAGNMGMLNVKDMYLELYEKFSSYKLKTEGMPRKLCYACHRQLQKFQRFSDMAQKSNRILHYLIQNGTEITHLTVTMLPLETIQNLTGDPTRCTSGNNYQYERSPPITVKEEPPVVIDDATQTIEVHIKLEEVDEIVVQENYDVTEQYPENYSSISDFNNMQPSSSSDNIDSKYNLVSHMKLYNEEKPFSCNVCKKMYTEKSSLTRHMQVHTSTKQYSCKKCSDVFHEKELLVSHMQTHTEDTNFFCKVCKKNFFDKCNLRRHMRVHTGERPYACNTCDKAFTVKGHLIAHMRIHTGERPYACSLCDKTFAENCNLRRHLLLHTGVKPYSCSTCSKTFTEKITLTRHLRIHTGEKPYFCQICDKTFSYKHNLTKHHVRIHKKKEADKETVDESKNPKCAVDLPTTSDHIESK